MGLDVCKEREPRRDQIRVMEAIEKTPVSDCQREMEVFPGV